MKTFFHSKNGLHKKIFSQKVAQNFLGKFEEIREKILRTLKNLLAPTPIAGMTCTLHKSQFHSCGVT